MNLAFNKLALNKLDPKIKTSIDINRYYFVKFK